jgi:toxin-antitoxin system PIN domain toxin
MKVIDSNILLYAVHQAAPQHSACRLWLENALAGDEEVGLTWVAINGFLRVSTHPKVFAKPVPVPQAVAHVQEWMDSPMARIAEPTTEHWTVIKELLLALGTGGNLTTDAHLAALAISHNATLVSCDTDFGRFGRLKWENPLAV